MWLEMIKIYLFVRFQKCFFFFVSESYFGLKITVVSVSFFKKRKIVLPCLRDASP